MIGNKVYEEIRKVLHCVLGESFSAVELHGLWCASF